MSISVTCQGRHRQPPPEGIDLDLQDARSTPESRTLGQQPQAHKGSLLGAAKIEEGDARTTRKGLAPITA
jgi:hypothetical protein